MRILCDFAGFYDNEKRQRESRRLALTAHALKLQGHKVKTLWNEPGDLWWSRYVPRDDLGIADVVIGTDATINSHQHGAPRLMIQTSQNFDRCVAMMDASDARVMAHARTNDLVEHFGDDRVDCVPWAIDYRIHDLLYQRRVLDAYLNDDLETVRSVFPKDKRRRAGGWFGGDYLYGRGDSAKKMPGWVEFKWNERPEPVTDWCDWTAECLMGIDLPGATWKTSRFSAYVLLGVAVVCCPTDGTGGDAKHIPYRMTEPYNPTDVPISDENAIILESWRDHETLESVSVERAHAVVQGADLCWEQAWSLGAQIDRSVRRTVGETVV